MEQEIMIYNNLKEICLCRDTKITEVPKNFEESWKRLRQYEIYADRRNVPGREDQSFIIVRIGHNDPVTAAESLSKKSIDRFLFVLSVPVNEEIRPAIIKKIRDIFVEKKVEIYESWKFVIHIPSMVSVPRHTIMTDKTVLSEYHLSLNQLPSILSIENERGPDIVSIWYEFCPGMLILIQRSCNTSLVEMTFRHAV
jgi:DNA-directed RNA polymerase subunit H (RpoH/RPB5)